MEHAQNLIKYKGYFIRKAADKNDNQVLVEKTPAPARIQALVTALHLQGREIPIFNLIEEHAWLVIFICLISCLRWQQHQEQLERLIPFCSRTSVCAPESPRAEAPVPERTPAMAAGFTDRICTVSEL
jgi:hypothetical protein